MKEMLQLF
ncbi:Protein of unknown function [Bacillus mycoides]|nr:Protein of unknown function [Bacillus mycoides]